MLKLLCKMLNLLDPDSFETQIRRVVRMRRRILQNLMASVGILRMSLLSVNSYESSEIVDWSIQLIDALGMGNNTNTLHQLKELLTRQIYGFSYFKMLEQKIKFATGEIIAQGMTGSQDSNPVD